ncbi:hypothetical protein [Vibrio phage VEN]|uniref:Tail tubular protein B n=1 Tax=Vibrio phage VEN TaxID=2059879 RepID=A0A2H5BMU2_9CAUD|nr:tail protein [Vibrio phage VEN]AUG87650.1 hypothetical protein [Vibrio phage VEN]
MGKVTGSWERPIQGVSQQADKDRIDGQCTIQENLVPSPLQGLIKRIGTRHIAQLLDDAHPDSQWYLYNRGDDESYIIVIEPNSLPRVFDIEGNERVVNATEYSAPYLSVSNPAKDLTLSTVADFTFILNKEVPTEERDDVEGENPAMAIVYLQFATYARDYEVIVDGVSLAKYTTPSGSDANTHPPFIKTNYIIEELANQINSVNMVTSNHTVQEIVGPPAQYYVTLPVAPYNVVSTFNLTQNVFINHINIVGTSIYFNSSDVNTGDVIKVIYGAVGSTNHTAEAFGNVLYLTANDGQPFEISTIDSADGNDLIAVQDKVRQVSNLPPKAPEGYIVEVQNKEGYKANSFWLKAESKDEEQTGSNVRWVESLAQGAKKGFKKETLPHVLVSEADGSFTLSYGEWEDREVGNDDTNAFPSFSGQPLRSLGIFQNRMLVTSGEAAIFGRTNRFFNFFRETTQEILDSDPIDIFADTLTINNLTHNAILDGDIVFFAENGQFILKGDKPITGATAILRQATSFPINVKTEPAITGESIMIPYDSGAYTGVRELFTDSFTDTKRARPITEHVAEYIEGQAVRMISSPNINTMAIQTDKDASILYMYDWLWVGDQRAQSAFHKWTMTGDILYAKFIRDVLYFVVKRANGVFLEVMPISSDADDNGLDFPVRLDQRTVVTPVWNNFRWEWTMPYKPDSSELLEFVRGEGCWEGDRGTSVIFETDGTLYWSYDDLADNLNGVLSCNLTAGTKFVSRFQPTQPFLRDQGGSVMGLDRLTLGKVTLNYESIGSISVTVNDKRSRRDWRYEYNGRVMGGWNNRVGFAPLDSGTFTFPVRMPTSHATFLIETEDYRPFVLRDMEWSGMFKQRGRRY